MKNQLSKKWLPLSWKVMAGWGIFNAIFAVIVPITSLFISPTIFTFGVEDAKFVGMSWSEIVASSPNMALWMVLMMVSMCSMHVGYSILTIYVSKRPYRNRERWAWHALIFSSLALFFYSIVITSYYVRRGLYGMFTTSGAFPSGVSIGVPFLVIMTAVFYVGLWLPRKELKSA